MANEFIGYGAGSECRAIKFGAVAPLKQPFAIIASVGIGGAKQRLLTAESYCNYAFDAQFNRQPK